MRFVVTVVAWTLAAGTAAGAEDIIIRPSGGVSPKQAHHVLSRLEHIQFAIEHCAAVPNKAVTDAMLELLTEAGSIGYTTGARDALERKAKTFGLDGVCAALIKSFGPDGTVIKGAISR